MARRNRKMGLMAPSHASALAALDFASASQAFDRAMTLSKAAGLDDETVADAISETADRLLGIPVTDPAHIAQKVRAYGWMNTITVDLADLDGQRRIAAGPHEHAKGLLAIYLDLKASCPTLPPSNALVEETAAVLDLERRANRGDDGAYTEWEAVSSAAIDAADALEPKPENLAAKIRGLRMIYEGSGGLDEFDAETTDKRLLRDIAKTLLAMGVGA